VRAAARGRADAGHAFGDFDVAEIDAASGLQAAAIAIWAGKTENVTAAQRALLHRARMNSLAATGKWRRDLEKKAA